MNGSGAATNGQIEITNLTLRTFMSIDMGTLVAGRGSNTVVERGRIAWLDDVLAGLGHGTLPPAFRSIARVESAYSRTDRFGRSTLTQDPGNGGLPVRLVLESSGRRFASSLSWAATDVEIGPSGALSLQLVTELAQGPVTDVDGIVSAYHIIRREGEQVFNATVVSLARLWNSRSNLTDMFRIEEDPSKFPPCLVFDVLDFDFTVDGRPITPKTLYESEHVDALRAVAGLTRMSSVFKSFDEASVRNLASFDIGSRSDELWIVNEARLVRRHPERGVNPYVDAFFEDVCTGVRMLTERASSLIFLTSWLKKSQSDILHRLARAHSTVESSATMKELLSVLTEMGYLVSDPAHLEDTSGHSFFRTVMRRTSDRLALETRREQIHSGVMDLLSLSQALSSQAVANSGELLQQQSLTVAKSSRLWAAFAVVFAIIALALTVLQVVVTFRSGNG